MVDPRRQQLTGITYTQVERRDVDRLIRTVGVVAYDEARLTDVSLKFDGWIERLLVDQSGELVKRGEELFTLYSPELVSTQEDYLTAYESWKKLQGAGDPRAVEAAAQLLEAARQRLSYWDIEPVHLRELEQNRTILRALPIHSPADGYVIEKNVVAGSHVRAGELLYRLADLDSVWILADVYEYELPFVHVDQPAEVTLTYLPGKTYEGRVSYVYPYLDTKERTVQVRIELGNEDHSLKAGMYTNVKLRDHRKGILTVPQSAIVDSGERQVAFVAREEGRFEPREVELGALFNGYYEVLGGLQEGERVVSSGNFLLDSESQLRSGMHHMQH